MFLKCDKLKTESVLFEGLPISCIPSFVESVGLLELHVLGPFDLVLQVMLCDCP